MAPRQSKFNQTRRQQVDLGGIVASGESALVPAVEIQVEEKGIAFPSSGYGSRARNHILFVCLMHLNFSVPLDPGGGGGARSSRISGPTHSSQPPNPRYSLCGLVYGPWYDVPIQ